MEILIHRKLSRISVIFACYLSQARMDPDVVGEAAMKSSAAAAMAQEQSAEEAHGRTVDDKEASSGLRSRSKR